MTYNEDIFGKKIAVDNIKIHPKSHFITH